MQVGVVGVGGFGVVAFYDEALIAAVLLAALVFLPLVLVGVYLRRTTALDWLQLIISSSMTWNLPILVGIGVTAAIAIGVGSMGGTATADFHRLGGPGSPPQQVASSLFSEQFSWVLAFLVWYFERT